MNRKSVKKFIKQLVPLDLILIQGITPFSRLIEGGSELLRGNGQFSHCGLVINKDLCSDVNFQDEKTLLFMEVSVSIGEKAKNLETGRFSFGAQVRVLEDVLVEFLDSGAGIAVCHLKHNPYTEAKKSGDVKKIDFIRKTMNDIYMAYFIHDQSVYELNIFALLGTIFPSVRSIRDDLEKRTEFIREEHPWLFCSELVCIIYKDLGLLDNDIDAQAYLPVDFINVGDHNKVNSIMELPPIFLKQIHTPTLYDIEKAVEKTIKNGVEKCCKIAKCGIL